MVAAVRLPEDAELPLGREEARADDTVLRLSGRSDWVMLALRWMHSGHSRRVVTHITRSSG